MSDVKKQLPLLVKSTKVSGSHEHSPVFIPKSQSFTK